MEKRTVKNFCKATAFALGLLFILYCTAGTCGYLTFGTGITQDIMQLYDAKDPIVLIGIVALTIKMITTYPPMVFCGRSVNGLVIR
jgi:PREDICTED: similar to solute carrier family 38, member 7